MAFFLLLVYLTLAYTRPFDIFRELAPFRIMLWLGLLGLAAASLNLFGRDRPTFRAWQFYLMIAFWGWVSFSRIVVERWLGGALAAFNEFGVTMTAFLLVVLTVNTVRRLRIVMGLLVVLSLYLVVQGTLAYDFGIREDLFVMREGGRLGPDASESELDAEEGVLRRMHALGSFNDPNDTAQALLTVLPFLGLIWARGSLTKRFFFVVIPALMLVYGVYLTRSRGGMLSLLLLIGLSLRERIGKIGALILAGMLGTVLLALNFTGGRAMREPGRWEAWSAGLVMLKASPIWGVGYGFFTDNHVRTAHNSYILCFAELGLVGYFLWLAVLLVTLFELYSITKLPEEEPEDHELRTIGEALALGFVTYLAAAWFLSRTYAMTLYIVIGLAVALAEIVRRQEKPLASFTPFALATRVGFVEAASLTFIVVLIKIYWA